jgi:hypothetical protein
VFKEEAGEKEIAFASCVVASEDKPPETFVPDAITE